MDVKAERGCATRDRIRLCGGLLVASQSERHDRKPRSRRQPGRSRRRPDESPAGQDFGVKATVMVRRLFAPEARSMVEEEVGTLLAPVDEQALQYNAPTVVDVDH